MKVFLVGGTGVIGRAAAAELAQAGHQVTSTARDPEKAAPLARLGVQTRSVDVYDTQTLRGVIRGFDAVIRLTTHIPPLAKFRDLTAWEETNRLRTQGARALVDACIAERIGVYVSESVSFVYADGGERILDETSPVDDDGTSMLHAALESEAHAIRVSTSGARSVVLRFGALYSAEDSGTREMVRMIRRWMLPRIGKARNYISPLFVADAGRAVAVSLNAASGIYNVVDDEPLPLTDYISTMVKALNALPPLRLPGALGPLIFGVPWRYFSRSLRVSNAAFKKEANWVPRVKNAREGWQEIAGSLRS